MGFAAIKKKIITPIQDLCWASTLTSTVQAPRNKLENHLYRLQQKKKKIPKPGQINRYFFSWILKRFSLKRREERKGTGINAIFSRSLFNTTCKDQCNDHIRKETSMWYCSQNQKSIK